MARQSWNILVSEPLSDRALGYLADNGTVARSGAEAVNAAVAAGEAPPELAQADALVVRTYTQVTDALLALAPRLKVVGRAGVAIDNIDVPACRARGVEVVHTPAANTLAVVDYTTRMIIEMNRRFWPMSGSVAPEEFHRTRKQTFGRFLADMTLGIVGAGRIGSRVGRIAQAAGMTVLYNDLKAIEVDYPAEAVGKSELYARSDLVTIHTSLNATSRGLIDADALKQFKDGAQFINAARGQCVDYAALASALRAGKLSFAVIDCHDPEPPPPDYPLFGLDNVLLTPHIAARVPAAVEAMCDVVHDVVAVLEGRRPDYPAELEDVSAP
ncbi:MAG: phosphoglycerate dehydrogenase [Phycisphaerae bacterium]|nr:phosphoglycerate dehydrogenase [Phycisphaerae bacterium]